MWFNLTDEHVATIRSLAAIVGTPAAKALVEQIKDAAERDADPANEGIRQAAIDRYGDHPWTDGDVDFDDAPCVSRGEDGAYVMAWFWVGAEEDAEDV